MQTTRIPAMVCASVFTLALAMNADAQTINADVVNANTVNSTSATATTVTADVVFADRHRNVDNGGNNVFWENVEDPANTYRLLYGPLASDGKVAVTEPNTRHRITGRGSAIWTGNIALGVDPALVTGAGQRMFWYPFKRAFRAGEVNGTQWDDANIGMHSIAGGLNTTASGQASVALGQGTSATQIAAFASGLLSSATGSGASALGVLSNATGNLSIAEGFGANASGDSSVALGTNVRASGARSFVLGATPFGTPAVENAVPDSLVVAFSNAQPGLFVGAGTDLNGGVGIGTNDPGGQRLFVNGDTTVAGNLSIGVNLMLAGQMMQMSDVRAKRHIRTLSGALTLVKKLRGIRFDWADESYVPSRGADIGFAAQEVEAVLPELVTEASNGYKAVAYQGMTPVLVEAIKEQQAIIDRQHEHLAAQDTRLEAQQALLAEQRNELDELAKSIHALRKRLETQ